METKTLRIIESVDDLKKVYEDLRAYRGEREALLSIVCLMKGEFSEVMLSTGAKLKCDLRKTTNGTTKAFQLWVNGYAHDRSDITKLGLTLPEMPKVDREKFPHKVLKSPGLYFSKLKVMKSPAGYYLGRTSWDENEGYEEPYSRDTDYMTKEEAEKALASGKWDRFRDAPENEHLKGLE